MAAHRNFLEELAAIAAVQQTHTYVVMEEVKPARAISIDRGTNDWLRIL